MLVSLKSMKGMTAAMLALLLAATLVAHETSGAPLPGYNAALPGQSLPLLEISRPRNGARLAGADVQVAIVLRPELVRGGLRDPRVCLSMQAVAGAARDVEVDPPGELPETCFRGSLNYTSFDLGGLVPGLSYGVTVGLESRGRVVAISSRTFSVAAVRLPGVERPVGIAEALDAGALLQQERPPRAEAAAKIYYDVLDQFPSLERAHHLLGVALLQLQDPDGGLAHLFQAVQLNDSDANFHHSLATALQAAKRSKEAIQHFERALELQPTSLQSAVTLGDVLHITGNWTGALAVYRRAVELGSQGDGLEGYVGVYPPEKYAKDCTSRICELLRVTEGWYPADRCLKDALNKWPGDAMFHHDRGNMLLTVGQFESALMEFQKSSSIGYTEAEVSVADALEALGETQASIDAYEAFLKSPDQNNEIPRTRAMVMKATVLPRILPASQAEIDEFRTHLEAGIDGLLNVVTTLEKGELDAIRLPFSTGVPLNSHNRNNRNLKAKLGRLYHSLLHDLGTVREASVTSYPMSPQILIQSRVGNSSGPPVATSMGTRRLRVGFVSRFIFNAAVGLYMDELIPQLDANKYETVVFAVGQRRSMKKRDALPQIADHIVMLPKDIRIVREHVKAWNIDVLIYPELGMDKTTYFLSFSRLAPVQATWWGNADTSGVPAVDYFLTSEYEHTGVEERYTEEVFPLKGMGIYHNLTELPQQNATRTQIRRAIQERFGIEDEDFRLYLCIESILHIHPDFDRAVQMLMEADEHAHMFLFSASSRRRWKDKLASRLSSNVTEGRVHFFADVDVKQETLLLITADAVIASLHLTRPRAAFQAFTAGVPVVALPGELWASRITYSFYREMGISELIATSLDGYVALAHKLANNGSFHDSMAHKVKTQRTAIANNRMAVNEWERFLDFAGARIYPSGDVGD